MDDPRTRQAAAPRTGTWRRHPLRLATAVLLVAVGATSALPAGASGSTLPCADRTTSAVFSRWLDPAQYFLAPNGGFEQGPTDWDVRGGAVVAGNERFQVGGASDAASLTLGAGASARSRTMCVRLAEPTVRLFVRTPSVLGATLTVTATVRNPATGLTLETTWVVVGGLTPAGWAPTPEILAPNLGGLIDEELTVSITTGGAPASWGVDDVYVDPYKHR